MNDGAYDLQGRFWAGTMAYDESPGAGALYRLELDGSCTTVLTRPDHIQRHRMDPDTSTVYLNDSGTGCVDAFRFDGPGGAISDRRALIRAGQGPGSRRRLLAPPRPGAATARAGGVIPGASSGPGSELTELRTWFGGSMPGVAGGGSLRTYLGIAPGVGKTFAMLAEGRRRAESGERVVVGWVESHGRPQTSRQLGGLEVIAPRAVAYRGAVFADFDAPAAIESGADVVLVDELAHATADRTRQRWQDVADVLRAGLDVVTTMNVAHLRSVRDFAARITGVGSVACVLDEFVRGGEVVLVDLPADVLRRRIASGAVYSAGQVGGALADYFRAANLRALSELARAWMAGTAEAVGADLLARLGLAEPPASPVVVAGIPAPAGARW